MRSPLSSGESPGATLTRSRELVLAGRSEIDAVRQSIDVGEAAALARRLERAHRPSKRKLIMNLSILGFGAVGLTAGIFLMAPNPALDRAVFDAPRTAPSMYEAPASLDDVRFSITAETTVAELVERIRAKTDLAVVVDWEALFDVELEQNTPLETTGEGLTLTRLLRCVAERHDHRINAFDWRFDQGGLELSNRQTFDRRESTLVSYEIESILQKGIKADEMISLIMDFVSPSDWEDNGGEFARLRAVGSRLFVEAPARMQTRTAWLLGELTAAEGDRTLSPVDATPRSAHAASDGVTPGSLRGGDVVRFDIYELENAGRWARYARLVEPDGVVRIPHLGSFDAAGKMAADLEADVARRAADFLADPQVSVYLDPFGTPIEASEGE